MKLPVGITPIDPTLRRMRVELPGGHRGTVVGHGQGGYYVYWGTSDLGPQHSIVAPGTITEVGVEPDAIYDERQRSLAAEADKPGVDADYGQA